MDENMEDDSGYEFEQILNAKHGIFLDGRIGYFVKWKGFPSTDNSWIDECDTICRRRAHQLLIEDFWRNHKQSRRKSDGAPNLKPKRVVFSEGDAHPIQKKRCRTAAVEPAVSDEEATPAVPKVKKTKTNNTILATKARESESTASVSVKSTLRVKEPKPESPKSQDEDEIDEYTLAHMEKWMSARSWEHIVDSVDGIERTEDGNVYVYFTLNEEGAAKAGGQKCREESNLCKDKLPLKLLDFYEDNLRWKDSGMGGEQAEE